MADKVIDLLQAAGAKEVYLYDKAEHDPSVDTVDRGTELAKDGRFEVAIGLGGGSAIDTAKTIACLVNNDGSAAEYQSGKEIKNPGIPFIALPTTAGTGAEITKNSVITDTKNKIKQSIRSNYMIAKVAIVDPILTVSMPLDVTAASGMDALTQAIEVCVSLSANPIGDTLGLRSIALISQNIVKAFDNGDDLVTRENMALGSLLGAMAFANAGLGAVHALAHPIGAMFDVPHGVICALLLPYVIEYNIPARTDKYAQIAEAMGVDTKGSDEGSAYKLISFIRDLLTRLKLPQQLRNVGIENKDISAIARSTRGSSLSNNPREASEESLEQILSAAL